MNHNVRSHQDQDQGSPQNSQYDTEATGREIRDSSTNASALGKQPEDTERPIAESAQYGTGRDFTARSKTLTPETFSLWLAQEVIPCILAHGSFPRPGHTITVSNQRHSGKKRQGKSPAPAILQDPTLTEEMYEATHSYITKEAGRSLLVADLKPFIQVHFKTHLSTRRLSRLLDESGFSISIDRKGKPCLLGYTLKPQATH